MLRDLVPPGSSVRRSRSRWAAILRGLGAETMIRDLDTPALVRWTMAETARGLAPGTVNRRMMELRSALGRARDLGHLAEIPRCPLLRDRHHRDRIATPEEVGAILEHLSPPMRLAVELAYWTAMRRGEVCALSWGQVDLKARVIRVRAHQTKTRRPRSVPISVTLGAILESRAGPPSDLVIGCRPQSVTEAFSRARSAARVDDLRFHDLRHTALTRLRRAGVDLFTLAAIAGHTSMASMRRYQLVSEADLVLAADRLDGTR